MNQPCSQDDFKINSNSICKICQFTRFCLDVSNNRTFKMSYYLVNFYQNGTFWI